MFTTDHRREVTLQITETIGDVVNLGGQRTVALLAATGPSAATTTSADSITLMGLKSDRPVRVVSTSQRMRMSAA